MLKSNSKPVIEKVKRYIMQSVDTTNYDIKIDTNNFNQVCNFIMNQFKAEKGYCFDKGFGSIQDIFIDWCSGLPSALACMYYYNVSAVDLLGEWLEETEKEKAQYTESQAEEMITKLIYRELLKGDK